jgi:hypothetical protein
MHWELLDEGGFAMLLMLTGNMFRPARFRARMAAKAQPRGGGGAGYAGERVVVSDASRRPVLSHLPAVPSLPMRIERCGHA